MKSTKKLRKLLYRPLSFSKTSIKDWVNKWIFREYLKEDPFQSIQ